MPTLTVTRNYAANTVLTEAQLDAAFDSIETFTNTTKLDVDNIQAGGVEGTNLNSNVVDATSLELSTNTLSIKDDGVSTAKVADDAITMTKLEDRTSGTGAGDVSLATASGDVTTSSSTYATITNQSITLTTTGRPVMLFLRAANVVGTCIFQNEPNASTASHKSSIRFRRDTSELCSFEVNTVENSGGTTASDVGVPTSSCMYIDVVGAGTYTYDAQFRIDPLGGGVTRVRNAQLVAYEI